MFLIYKNEVLADSPSLYLRLGESSGTAAADSSGNALNGVYHGTPTLGAIGALAADVDTAVILDGATQYITVADNALLDPGDIFTLEAWVKLTSAPFSAVIFDKGANGYVLSINSGFIVFYKNGAGVNLATSSAAISTGIWHHIVATKSGSTRRIYVDGVNVTALDTNSTVAATATDLNIGRLASSSSYLPGTVDEVALYPTALSAKRVFTHYTAGADSRRDTAAAIALIEIDWDTGTEYYSFCGVRSPSAYYEDLVSSIDPINREVSLFGSSFNVGTVNISLENRALVFSKKWANTPIRGRAIRVKMIDTGLGITSAITLFSGRIVNYKLNTGVFHIEARDTRYDELFNSKVSLSVPLITPIKFSALPVTQVPVLAPLVFGRVGNLNVGSSSWGGALPTYLVDTAASPTAFIYVICARPTGADPAFAVSEQWQYHIYDSTGGISTKTYSGNTYGVWARATDPRDAARVDEMEITVYANGISEDDNPASDPIVNPVRWIEYLLDTYTSISTADFNTALQTRAKNAAASQGYADDFITSPSPDAYLPACMGGAIVDKDLMWHDVIEFICNSFGMQLYATREGALATYVDTDAPLGTSDYSITDEIDIIKDTLNIANNEEIATQIECNWGFRWAFGVRGDMEPGPEFERTFQYVIPGEKLAISPSSQYDIMQSISLHCVRNGIRAAELARVYAEYYKSGAQWITLDLPIAWYRYLELNNILSVTHWQGTSATGGYSSVQARVVGISINVQPRSARISLKLFRRASSTIVEDDFSSGALSSSWTSSSSVSIFGVSADSAQAGKYDMRAQVLTTPTARGVLKRTDTFGNNQVVRARLTLTGDIQDKDSSGIFVRGSGTYNSFTGYAAVVRPFEQTLELRKFSAEDLQNGGTGKIGGTLLGSAVAAIVPGGTGSYYEKNDELELRVNGTTLEIWVYSQRANRTGLVMSVTDADIASGTTGFLFVDENAASLLEAAYWREFHANDF